MAVPCLSVFLLHAAVFLRSESVIDTVSAPYRLFVPIICQESHPCKEPIWGRRGSGPPVGAKGKTAGILRCLPFFWRGRRDLNPRDGFPPYSLSRGAPSATWVLPQVGDKAGGESGIRTHGCFHIAGFQDRCFRPLSHLSVCKSKPLPEADTILSSPEPFVNTKCTFPANKYLPAKPGGFLMRAKPYVASHASCGVGTV